MAKVTIYDVAKQAGVAPSTVSRAFGVPGRVTEETRRRVVAAAQELGYESGAQSRSPEVGRHRTIAMVLADITNPHFFEVIRGAEQRVRAADHTMILVNAEESARTEHEQIRALSTKVDGFILASSRLTDQALRDLAGEHQVVLLNRELEGLISARLDTALGCRQIVEHLAGFGHRGFTFCAGPAESWVGSARWADLSRWAEELGLRATRVGPYTPTVASGGPAADAAMRTGATAVIAHNDLLGIGIVQRLAARGITVPGDVSVVGFDDIFAAELVETPLTTLGGQGVKAGRTAVEMLLASLHRRPVRSGSLTNDPADRVILPSELRLRASSGPVRG